MKCRQEVVPGHRAAGLTLERQNETRLVLFRDSQPQIDGREYGKDVSLND